MKRLFFILFILPLCLSAQNSDKEAALRKLYKSKIANFKEQSNCDSAIYYYYQDIDLASDIQYKIARIGAAMKTYEEFHRAGEAYKLGLVSLEKYCNDSTKQYNSYQIVKVLVRILETIGDYDGAIELLKNHPTFPEQRAHWYYNLAKQYVLQGAANKALRIAKELIKKEKSNNPISYRRLINAYNNLGLIAGKIGNSKIAKDSYFKAIHLIDSTQKQLKLKPTIVGNVGALYLKEGKIDSAYSYLQEDSRGSLKFGVLSSYINAEVLLSEIDLDRSQVMNCIQRLERLLSQYKVSMSNENKLLVYELLIKSHTKLKNFEQQQFYLDQWTEFMKEEKKGNQEVFNISSKLAVEQIRLQLKTAQELSDKKVQLAQQENENLQQQNEKDQLIYSLMILGLIMVILSISLFVWRRNTLLKKDRLLKEAELETSKKEQEILELKIKEESRNVRELSLELITKQEFSKIILEKLNDLGTLSKSDLVSINMFIENELKLKSSRAQIQNQMGDMSGNFHTILKLKHPTLTDNELKLAAMIVMKMSNKEISISKNVTSAYVRTAKVRLKKKMNLDQSQDLFEYLSALL